MEGLVDFEPLDCFRKESDFTDFDRDMCFDDALLVEFL